ncbi:MAG: hypothetical protein SOY60_06705, partial [Fusobacterium gastrosuis]|uniref:hypothetical protein n=1 Tax=Fusobacterium gastrosuis TaxID=1755100 RepID=UPI002A8A5EEA|nr:hypothetical protein [Fusobacterium gastrosuis]
LPELLLTDEPNSFAHNGKIFISINDLNSGNASALLYAHENAHLVDYDKGEEIAKYAETKIGKNDPNEKFTESEREEYINSLRERVKIDKTLEEQFEIARSVPENEREKYEVILVEKEVTFKVGGLRGGTGIIYNENPITGEEEYGIVTFFEPEIGPNIVSGGVGVKTYSKEGIPIKDFEGFFGTVKGIAGIGIRGSAEIEINGVNDINYSIDANVGSGTIGFLAGIGYRKVLKINPPIPIKVSIKKTLKNRETIKNSYETIEKLREIIKYSESLK